MIFGTLEIWLLLPLTILLFYALPSKYRWTILLLGSILYLGYYSIPFLIYASVYAIANYYFGRILYPISNLKTRKRVYLLFLVINILQLVVFKYINFLIENFNWVLLNFNIKELSYIKILIPIGISYFTFQCIGYTINIYRKIEKPEKHIGYFLIYNLFFPKILSGPIERSEKFLPQLRNPQPLSPDLFYSGLKLILFGMFKKLIIAERLAIIINNVYGNIENYTGYSLIIVMFIQAIYIFTDFSGYTDIALGIARLFGINLTDNFNRPFFARNVSDFWRRWHISLSSWCNDYIFKTIIFKRRKWGQKAAVYGVFVTFIIIGIWHGAMWTYVMLGILQGLAINYEFFTKRTRLQIGSRIPVFWNNTISRIITYTFMSFSLIFFFSKSFSDSIYFVRNMFVFKDNSLIGNNLGLEHKHIFIVTIAIIVVFVIQIIEERGVRLIEKIESKSLWLRWASYYLIIYLILMFGMFATTNFVYLQF